MKEILVFPEVLESIKINVFKLEHKNILVKENSFLPLMISRAWNMKLKLLINSKEWMDLYIYIYIYIQIYPEMPYAIIRLPILGVEIARARKRFLHTLFWHVSPQPATVTQSAQTTIPLNHHKTLGLRRSKKKWWAICIYVYI